MAGERKPDDNAYESFARRVFAGREHSSLLHWLFRTQPPRPAAPPPQPPAKAGAPEEQAGGAPESGSGRG